MCVARRASARTFPASASSTRLTSDDVVANEFDRVSQTRSWAENGRDPHTLDLVDILARDRAAGNDEHVVELALTQGLHDPGKVREMGTGKNAKSDHVNVFLQRGICNHFGRLEQASVDHLHPCISEGAHHYLRTAIVSVETRLGDQYPDWRGSLTRPRGQLGLRLSRFSCHNSKTPPRFCARVSRPLPSAAEEARVDTCHHPDHAEALPGSRGRHRVQRDLPRQAGRSGGPCPAS